MKTKLTALSIIIIALFYMAVTSTNGVVAMCAMFSAVCFGALTVEVIINKKIRA